MKLHEEFKEYENLWESTDTASTTSLMWTLPNGEEIDLNDEAALQAEQERVAAVVDNLLTQDKLNSTFRLRAKDVKVILTEIRERLIKINDAGFQITDRNNNAIINKLRNYTNIGDKVDLEDIRRQLNARATTVYKEKLQQYVDRLNAELVYLYNAIKTAK